MPARKYICPQLHVFTSSDEPAVCSECGAELHPHEAQKEESSKKEKPTLADS